LGTLTIYLEGAHCADMLHYDIAHDSDTWTETRHAWTEAKEVVCKLACKWCSILLKTSERNREHHQSPLVISKGTMSVSKNQTQRAYQTVKTCRPNQTSTTPSQQSSLFRLPQACWMILYHWLYTCKHSWTSSLSGAHSTLKVPEPLNPTLDSSFPGILMEIRFMVPYDECNKIVEVCELTTLKRPKEASIQSPFLKGNKPEMTNSELMKQEMLRQDTPSIRTMSWFISLGHFCIHTGIMSVLLLSPLRRNQNLARLKPVHIYLTLLEHPSIRLRANVPELPFDRGKDVNALDWITLFRDYPTVKSPIVTSFTAVTPRLLVYLKTYLMTGIEIS
jgi:hypothetical protein